MKTNVFRDGKIHVCSKMCETCIYRKSSPVQAPGLPAFAAETGNPITCHSTYKWRNRRGNEKEQNLICFGYFSQSPSPELLIAQSMDAIRFVPPPKLTERS